MPTPLIPVPLAASNGVANVGTALVVLMCAAQLPSFWLVYKKRLPIASLSFLPTLGQSANFVAWTLYGVAGTGDPNVIIVNVAGIGFVLLYVALFVAFSPPPARALIAKQVAALAAVVAPIEAGLLLALPRGAARTQFLAYVAMTFGVIMFASPIAAVRAALLRFDASKVPVVLTIASLGCSSAWALYGAMIGDLNILAPNALGALLSLAQVATAAYIFVRLRADPGLAPARYSRLAGGAGDGEEGGGAADGSDLLIG
jgi:solute carrier family 50 protein (sugar transporter)